MYPTTSQAGANEEVSSKAMELLSTKPVLGLIKELVTSRLSLEELQQKNHRLRTNVRRLRAKIYEQAPSIERVNSLETKVLELQEQVARLHLECRKLAVTCETGGPYDRKINQLPNEVLLNIFQLVGPPCEFFESSYSLGPIRAMVLSTMRSAVLVCKSWWQVGMELLYDEVALCRAPQVTSLARTLESNKHRINYLIHKVVVQCYIQFEFENVFAADIRRILDLCPNLRFVRFNPLIGDSSRIADIIIKDGTAEAFQKPFFGYYFPYRAFTSVFNNFGHSLTGLDIPGGVPFTFCLPLLKLVCFSLVSLDLRCVIVSYGNVVPDCKLSFPHLESLRVENEACLEKITENWVFGRLQQYSSWMWPYDPTSRFLQAHGGKLIYLSCPEVNWIGGLLGYCPALEHLVISAESVGSLTHPRIVWVDIWTKDIVSESGCYKETDNQVFDHKGFPSLKRVRFLDDTLSGTHDIPRLIPPNRAMDDDNLAYTLRMIGIERQETYIIHRTIELYINDEDVCYHSDSSSSSSGSDDSESTGWSTEFSDSDSDYGDSNSDCDATGVEADCQYTESDFSVEGGVVDPLPEP